MYKMAYSCLLWSVRSWGAVGNGTNHFSDVCSPAVQRQIKFLSRNLKAAHPVCSSPSVCSPSLRYTVHNIPSLDHIQSQMKPSCSLFVTFTVHLYAPRSTKWWPFRFCNRNSGDLPHFYHECYVSRPSRWRHQPNTWGDSRNYEARQFVAVSILPSLPLSQVQIFRSESGQVDTATVLRHRNRILCAPNRPDHSDDPPSLLLNAYLRLFLRRYNGRGVKLLTPSHVPSLPHTSADYIVTKEFRVLQAPPSPCTLTRVSPSVSALWCSGRTQSQTHSQC
jgi:hypothetical protein